MGQSKLCTELHDTHQKSSRFGSVPRAVQLHHAYNLNYRQTVAMMVSGSRQVSATVAIQDKNLAGVVDELYRPWTSGSASKDSEAVTAEISNASLARPYPVSGESHETAASWAADVAFRWGFKLDRSSVYGHGEMLPRWGVSYATECPGGLNVDWIANEAERRRLALVNNTPTLKTPEEDVIDLINCVESGAVYSLTSEGIAHVPDMAAVTAIQSYRRQRGLPEKPARLYRSELRELHNQSVRSKSNGYFATTAGMP